MPCSTCGGSGYIDDGFGGVTSPRCPACNFKPGAAVRVDGPEPPTPVPPEGGECAQCRFRIGSQCRRWPQVVVQMATQTNDQVWVAEWDFPPAGLRCGEHSLRIGALPFGGIL